MPSGLPFVRSVAEHVPAGARCLVIEDNAHTYEKTLAALRGFTRLVPDDGFLVVEDGCVDIKPLRLADNWPRRILPALSMWLERERERFVVRSDLELAGVTCDPGGSLQRSA